MNQEGSPVGQVNKEMQNVQSQEVIEKNQSSQVKQAQTKQNIANSELELHESYEQQMIASQKVEQNNNQKSEQPQTINTDLIYRKKSELLGHLKLKTYDANEDEEDPQPESTSNPRIITIEADQEEEARPVQNQQQLSNQSENVPNQKGGNYIEKSEDHQQKGPETIVHEEKTQQVHDHNEGGHKQNQQPLNNQAQQLEQAHETSQNEHLKDITLKQAVQEEPHKSQNDIQDNSQPLLESSEQGLQKLKQTDKIEEKPLQNNQKPFSQQEPQIEQQHNQKPFSQQEPQIEQQNQPFSQEEPQIERQHHEKPFSIQEAQIEQQGQKRQQLLEPQIVLHMVSSFISQLAQSNVKNQNTEQSLQNLITEQQKTIDAQQNHDQLQKKQNQSKPHQPQQQQALNIQSKSKIDQSEQNQNPNEIKEIQAQQNQKQVEQGVQQSHDEANKTQAEHHEPHQQDSKIEQHDSENHQKQKEKELQQNITQQNQMPNQAKQQNDSETLVQKQNKNIFDQEPEINQNQQIQEKENQILQIKPQTNEIRAFQQHDKQNEQEEPKIANNSSIKPKEQLNQPKELNQISVNQPQQAISIQDLPQISKIQQKPNLSKATSWKSRKIQKPVQNITQPTKKVVRNRSLHQLVVNIHKTEQDPVKLPLHRPSNSQRKIRGKSPNLNRLKYNIGLDSKIIDLTVGEIFEEKHKRNDEMKSMLLKQISTLREQIQLYESDEKNNQVVNTLKNHESQHFQSPNKAFRTSKQQFQIQKQSSQLLTESERKKSSYYTQRAHKLPLIAPGEIQHFQYPQDQMGHNFSAFNEGSQSYLQNELMISSPQKRGNAYGKIVRRQNHETLRNSRAQNSSELNESKFSRTVNGSEQSFVQDLSSGQALQSPSKASQGSRQNQSANKRTSSVNRKKIGSIINKKQAATKPIRDVIQSQVNAPGASQLQVIPLPDKFVKQIDWKSVKEHSWSELHSQFDGQFNSVIQKTSDLPFPTAQSSQEDLVHFAHLTFFTFGINIQSQDCLLNIKRYKNCIVFNLTNADTIIYHFEGRKIYFGGWNGNAKEGWGLQITDSHVYQGQFSNNKKNEIGVMRAKKLTTQQQQLTTQNNYHKFVYYFGHWQHNYKQNFGIQIQFTQNHVIEYQGEWQMNKKNGQGLLSIYNRKNQQKIQVYEGGLAIGYKNGNGKQKFANGDTYEGQYSQNKFQGKGKYTWHNGACYIGNFIQGIRQGKGQWFSDAQDCDTMQNVKLNGSNSKLKGDYYKGDYKSNKKHGFGIYRWKNGTIYEGEFENDQKVGEGMVILENDAVYNAQTKVKSISN